MRQLRVTEAARQDLRAIFTATALEHGTDALALVQIAIEEITTDPTCPGSRERTELGTGLYS
jgi:hypothetical protein